VVASHIDDSRIQGFKAGLKTMRIIHVKWMGVAGYHRGLYLNLKAFCGSHLLGPFADSVIVRCA
jgi:hypothetical protein